MNSADAPPLKMGGLPSHPRGVLISRSRLLLENPVLTRKPFILSQKVLVGVDRPGFIGYRLHPLAQGRKPNPQIRCNLTPRQAAGRRDTNRITFELVAVLMPYPASLMASTAFKRPELNRDRSILAFEPRWSLRLRPIHVAEPGLGFADRCRADAVPAANHRARRRRFLLFQNPEDPHFREPRLLLSASPCVD